MLKFKVRIKFRGNKGQRCVTYEKVTAIDFDHAFNIAKRRYSRRMKKGHICHIYNPG